MTTRLGLPIVLTLVCLGLGACGGSNQATPTPTTPSTPALAASRAPAESTATSPAPTPEGSYLGAVVGTWRDVSGETYITESGTGVYYQVRGVRVLDQSFGQVLFAIGLITPVPNVHLIQAKQLVSVPENGGVSCKGTLAKREGRYFVESSAVLGCGSIELIESDPQKLDPQVGQETTLMVRSCTVTKGGRMVKTDLDLGFTCSSPSP